MTSGLLDTSVFIAREADRPLGILPERVAVSVVTIGELELGVLAAVGAPSSLAVHLAAGAGLCTAGFVRGSRYVVYSAPERLGV